MSFSPAKTTYWKQQPQFPAPITSDYPNPIGLITPFAEHVAGVPLVKIGTSHSKPIMGNDVGVIGDGASLIRTTVKKPFVVQTDAEGTIVLRIRISTYAANGFVSGLGATTGSSGNTLVYLVQNPTTSGKINFHVADSTGFAIYNSSNFPGTYSLADSKWHTIAISFSLAVGGTATLSVDGQNMGEVNKSAGSIVATTFQYLCLGGLHRGGTDFFSSAGTQTSMIAFFHEKLSVGELNKITSDPFSLFKPIKKPWLDVVSAGGILLKTYLGLSQASIKTFDGNANASTKTVDGLSNV